MTTPWSDNQITDEAISDSSADPRSNVLVIVHPGSACGSADFNCGSFATAESCRQSLIQEWKSWQGGVMVIDGALSDELPRYPELKTALDDILARADARCLLAVRFHADDPTHAYVITAALRKSKLPTHSARFVVTGAWHYPEDGGCVGSVACAIRTLGYRATISPAALSGEPNPKVECGDGQV